MNKLFSTFLVAPVLIILVAFTTSCNSVATYGQNKNNESTKNSLTVAQAIEKNRGSIVQIISKLDPRQVAAQGKLFFVHGSGFVIGEEYAVTALHVIKNPNVRTEQMRLALPMPYSEKIRGNYIDATFEVVEEDLRHDLALLRFKTTGPSSIINGKEIKLPQSIAKLDIERPVDGTQVVSSGYPLNNIVLISNAGWIASSWEIDTSQLTNGTNNQIPQFSDSYLLDMTVNHGNSGGPVYVAETGKVIGVCVQIRLAPVEGAGNAPLSYNSGISVAVPIKYVFDMLKKHNIKVEN